MSMFCLRCSRTFSKFPARAARRKDVFPSDWNKQRGDDETKAAMQREGWTSVVVVHLSPHGDEWGGVSVAPHLLRTMPRAGRGCNGSRGPFVIWNDQIDDCNDIVRRTKGAVSLLCSTSGLRMLLQKLWEHPYYPFS